VPDVKRVRLFIFGRNAVAVAETLNVFYASAISADLLH
jgi:hypothetical protein